MRIKLAVLSVVLMSSSTFLSAQSSEKDLDAVATRAVVQEHVVGASVLVARGDRILLHKAYGEADLGLDVPTKPDSVYHIVGPTFSFVGIAVMQQVERGKLSLDDDLSKFVPEFPMQGHHVSIRQLLNHTSGIPDYHYLGDPLESTHRRPKAMDEVTALYAGHPWVHEPGTKWDWTISDFSLLVTILERVTGQSYDSYVRENILVPSGANTMTLCDDSILTRGLSTGYERVGDSFVVAREDDMSTSYELRYCSTVTDLFHVWRALRTGKLVRPETLKQMSTAEGAAVNAFATDRAIGYGLSLVLSKEDDHLSIGHHGASFGHSASLYEFPADDLTVIVLSNVGDQSSYQIGRALARQALGLPPLPAHPAPAPARTLSDISISAAERSQISGTYLLRLPRFSRETDRDSFEQYQRTYRVFEENGRLMIEPLGEAPERLLKQADGSFARSSSPESSITFVVQNNHAIRLNIDQDPYHYAGERIGPEDLHTFYRSTQDK